MKIEGTARQRLGKFDVAAGKIVVGWGCTDHLPVARGATAAWNVDM